MEDFNVKITVRNNRLLQAVRKKYESVADLSRKMGRSQGAVNALVSTSTSEFTIDMEGVKQIMSDNSAEKMIAHSQVLQQLDTRLNDTQKKVIDMRFYQKMSLEETGKVLGLSRERVRQIECKSLRRMRYDAKTQGYLKPRNKNNKDIWAKLEKTDEGCELFE
jgi:RNA polymerase sigma factor (sigma-70 family)